MTVETPNASRPDIESILTELARVLGRALARRRLGELRNVDTASAPPVATEMQQPNDESPPGSA